MVMYCPYCDIEINETQLESEDGCCPECGAFISPGMVVTDSEDEDDFDEFDDELNGDDFDDGEMDDMEDFDEK